MITALVVHFAPFLLQIPHYSYAIVLNIYLDLKYRGLWGTLVFRFSLKPRKQTLQSIVDYCWDSMRALKISKVDKLVDKEISTICANFDGKVPDERKYL